MIQTVVEAAPIIVPVVQGVALDVNGVAIPNPPLTARQKSLAAKAAPSRSKVSTNLDDFDVSELKKALASAKGGSIKVHMAVERARYLQSSFGSA